LSRDLKAQTREFVCNSFTVKESMDLEPRVIMWVNTTLGSNKFMVKSIVQTSILLVKYFLEYCLG